MDSIKTEESDLGVSATDDFLWILSGTTGNLEMDLKTDRFDTAYVGGPQ